MRLATIIAGCSALAAMLQVVSMKSTGVGISGPSNSAPPSGLVFSPSSCSSSCSVAISYTPASDTSIFYAVNAQAYPATTLYQTPVAIPGSSTTTLSAVVANTGAGGGIVQGQQNQTGTGASAANWKSVVTAACCSGNPAPVIQVGKDFDGSCTSPPSSIALAMHQAAPSLDGQTMHISLTNGTTCAGVLYVATGPWPAPSGSFIAMDWWVLQGINGPSAMSYEIEHDGSLYDRNLQLTTAYECVQNPTASGGPGGSPRWRVNGQSGGWHNFPVNITQDCPIPFGSMTAVSSTATTFTASTSIETGSTISVCNSAVTTCENMLVVTGGTSPTVLRHQNGTTAQAWPIGTIWRQWVHVETLGIFNPGVKNCNSNTIECVYFAYIVIDGTFHGSTLYGGTDWGTQVVKNASGQNITVPSLTYAAATAGGTQRCFSQDQLYGVSGKTVDMFIDEENNTCGYVPSVAQASPRYVTH
jgi:hypothetical protein